MVKHDDGNDDDSRTMLWLGVIIVIGAVLFTIYMAMVGTEGLVP